MGNQSATRILALDVGQRRIGCAVSDPLALTAQPLCVLERKNRDADIDLIARLAREEGAGLIVLGLPLWGGEVGEAAQKMLNFGRRLSRRLDLPVEYVDEEDSTLEAEEALLMADISRTGRRKVVDKLAAVIILRRYLAGQGEKHP